MPADTENKTAVKICGLTNLEDARFAAGALADFIGFIFFDESPRYINPPKAGAIVNWIEGPKTVGVFVNQPLDDVNMISRQVGLDLVQLHGTESSDYCQLVEKPVMKVFHIESGTTAESLQKMIEPYLEHVDYLLFDKKTKGLWGGTGEVFDWDILKNLSHGKPFLLSGGISTANVRDACRNVRPFAVDLSSSVEQAPGIKDYDKIELFFNEMREIWELQESGKF